MNYKQIHIVFLPLSILVLAAIACSFNPLVNGDDQASEIATLAATAVPVDLSPTAVAEVVEAPVEEQAQTVQTNQSILTELALEERLVDLYQRVNPSVVHILVYTNRNDFGPLGSGSGFIFDDKGRIVTNNHVVTGGQDFEVIFADGSRRWAETVGTDVDSDLAVIEVDSLPESALPIELGDSDELRVGQFVIAIGNPFGEQGSMSLGIVSGLGRTLESQRPLEESAGRYSLPQVVQTDAPINPGNSGGPLLDLEGKVVGVNSAIRTTTGTNSGVGFSIPVNAVQRIIPRLIEEGRYIYSYMGVQIQSLNLTFQEQLDLPRSSGAYVTGITPGSPAEDAGLVPAQGSDGTGGDLIVAIDGQTIDDTDELIGYLVFNTEVGQTIDLTVIRDGETINLPLTLGPRP
jgi:2-alkenal reductase